MISFDPKFTESFQQIIVVTPKGSYYDHVYENGALVYDGNNYNLPPALYNYGFVKTKNDSDPGDYDRIIVSYRRLKRGQVIKCVLSEHCFSFYDSHYDKRVKYFFTYDVGASFSQDAFKRALRCTKNTKKAVMKTIEFFKVHNAEDKAFSITWWTYYR